MTYPQAVRYLESFINYEKISHWQYKGALKLARFRAFLSSIGNPQNSLRVIHIAGTKGKGSTCAFIAYILCQAGFKAGLYTSPHLIDFRERIRILSPRFPVYGLRLKDFEGMISRRELAGLVEELRPAIKKFHSSYRYGPLTFFEIYTAVAFLYFQRKRVDFTVLETGLGGRLDATNATEALVSVITPISYEHTDKLGKTLRQIAGEKAGIIKGQPVAGRRSIVISAPQEKEARGVIRKKAAQAGALLLELGRDIRYGGKERNFWVQAGCQNYRNLRIRLTGSHQVVNAAAAVAAAESLKYYGIGISKPAVRAGLFRALWPGRCEVVARHPYIVLDGAQNAASAAVLKKAVRENFRYKKLVLVLGVSSDKDIKGICRGLVPLADTVVLTQADSPRAAPVEKIAKFFKGQAFPTYSVREAIKQALRLAGKDDLILVTGSLFVVGEWRKYA